jgi:hypothetical protein
MERAMGNMNIGARRGYVNECSTVRTECVKWGTTYILFEQGTNKYKPVQYFQYLKYVSDLIHIRRTSMSEIFGWSIAVSHLRLHLLTNVPNFAPYQEHLKVTSTAHSLIYWNVPKLKHTHYYPSW